MKKGTVVASAAAIVVVFVVSVILMKTTVPAAEAWTAEFCVGARANGCDAVEAFLAWWWAALLVLVGVPLLFTITRRRRP